MLPVLSRLSRKRALQGAAASVVALGLLVWWLVPFGSPSPSGTIDISTGVRTGVYQRYGELLRQALATDLPDVQVELRTSEGSQQNLQRVADGVSDFTIATADSVDKFRKDGKPGADELRGCARLYDDYVQLVVPRDSPVRSVADLRGKRVAVGQDGSGVRLLADRLLPAAGLDPQKDITPVPAGIDTMPELLRGHRIDAFFWSGGLPTTAVLKLSQAYPIRLVPLADLVSALHKADGSTGYYRAATMPADAYPQAQRGVPVPTIAVANLLVTTDRTGAALTEGFTRTVINSRDRIGREVHAAQLVDLRTAIYTNPLPLHDGARDYYRSVKP
ncbi:TAXI family TRAP transporter solute-binding subunit [Streptomyces sp. NBC_00083]|uniref:TAXI family TRAP transporter solute-binding subunit n=1 Tax=Streptomyces sp. NBC_00083 TaxID=2975647 RepID=UPI002259EBED|nr:TAXI family TRAP transporter solute-binding subunit [Streptomyces sp. NBC_00083]MCX5386091.1 TAXI family TRAP transporter solute-binding subunit [Streptomyces sp. NBC_00083]